MSSLRSPSCVGSPGRKRHFTCGRVNRSGPRHVKVFVRSLLLIAVAWIATACGGSNPPVAKIGGVIEVHFDTNSHAAQSRIERACGLDPAFDPPPSLASDEGWYRDPGGTRRDATFACLHDQPHVLRAALPL